MRSFKLPQLICVLALLVGGPGAAVGGAGAAPSPAAWSSRVGYPYYSPFFWGSYYGSPFWGPYGYWPPPYGYYGGYYDYASDVRVMATPREAEVYVDGYLVGTVDDFDGWSQRLRLQPGEHEIELYLEGYRSVRQKMLFRPGRDLQDSRGAREDRAGRGAGRAARARARCAPGTQGPSIRRHRTAAYQPPPILGAADAQRGFGTLAIRVQPGDAVVVVDGERWDRPEGDPRLSVELSAGTHQVEVRKDGHKTYTSSVQVRAGEVTTLNVSLPVEP